MSAEPLLTYDDIAARLNLPRRTVENMARRRAIPVVKINKRCHRFNWLEVQAAVAKLTVRPRA